MTTSVIDLATVQAALTSWIAAREKIAKGQGFTLNGRTLTRADLAEVRRTIADLTRQERTLLQAQADASNGRDSAPFGFSLGKFK